ncbi:methionyl-tRNA formyltransferase [Candidatus Tachikawaea gelatinosa]|uniref:Methionyl-tRNA formyltransferase n=1 Tax=Candidatus Tachikawaea gelatinosa TaxID=1410383 RepID=A0A090AQA7_9ENTR|nr:methionyl-tRNA formyltransferase [Candidatus Tachikawaea gelatinosa]BAP58532.1 methionyl-tRNA formyltransferase [Candidatus Tachikawaea gelatinosa]
MSKLLKIIFAGTPDFSANHLSLLCNSHHKIVGIFTQPDRKSGRGKKNKSSPVKLLAQSKKIPVFYQNLLSNNEMKKIIISLNPDIMIVVAYGYILSEEILSLFPLGGINVHASLLPKWRGATPIQHALLSGDKETGISIIKMNAGIDTGDILYKKSLPIHGKDNYPSLYKKLALLGSKSLIYFLNKLVNNEIHIEKQNNIFSTYAKKFTKKDSRINWNLTAIELERCIRAFHPWPSSYFLINNKLIKVLKASVLEHFNKNPNPGEVILVNKQGIQVETNSGILNLEIIQPPNKKPMLVKDFINAYHNWISQGFVIP